MHFAKGVTCLVLLVLGVRAAPGTKRPVSISGEASTAKQPKPLAESPQPSRPKLLPKPNSLVGKLTVIDGSCRPTTARFVQVEQALSDAYDIVEVGQRINSEDTAFTNYFVLNTPSAKKVVQAEEEEDDKAKLRSAVLASSPERKPEKLVPNMATSIVTGGGTNKQIHVRCPTPEVCGTSNRVAFVRPDEAAINLCEGFFARNPVSHAWKPFNLDASGYGWCRPPYLLTNFLTRAEIILHEMTHIKLIASHALALSGLAEGEKFDASKPVANQWFAQDIYDHADENDANNKDTYDVPWVAARTLAQRWIAYIAHLAKPEKAKAPLNPPPFGTADNAESYATAFIEYFFYVKCKAFKFDPKKITL
ncbi:hypothetical protein BT96DRAFT_596980 [Gymnopus androsaceus JB14]|uniref:Lysine-specific metallo-endopeptidase domain-containing protein n=1 Tax=Gymnopus androsaceus JB14 TaxID=1447944 RepID=A0A6A4GIW8_9AGAR|nr:hypothetical protein BT96DRAFT_596980 [Gymnopus androsaceus JB14]